MASFLSQLESVERADAIREEFERLLATPQVAPRPRARQWVFLRWCLDTLLGGTTAEPPFSPAQVRQYKFEVQQRLRRYYLAPGRPVRFQFMLMDTRLAFRDGVIDHTYPTTGGYALLVADVREDMLRPSVRVSREVLQRVVRDAIDAEFRVYRRLPTVDLTPLEGLFLRGGPAYKRIAHLARKHRDRKWTIQRPPDNPSTQWTMRIEVVSVSPPTAVVRTKEYWYLRWWSMKVSKYEQKSIYQRTSHQRYLLRFVEGTWLVEHNDYPPALMAAVRRRSEES